MENTYGNNELICEQIRIILHKKQNIIKAICSQNEGFINIFIRNGKVQKLLYQRNVVVADRTTVDAALNFLDSSDEETTESYFESKQLIPDYVYRRFSYMIAASTLTIEEMQYGHLRFHFTFEKNEEDWQESFKLTFDEEYHFKDSDFPSIGSK